MWKTIGNNVKIINSYRSDHCPIIFQLKLNDFILGRGYGNLIIHFYMRWIMLKLLKKLLRKTKEQYAGLVYDRSTLSEIDDPVIHFYNKR